jgi:hypothetical protein
MVKDNRNKLLKFHDQISLLRFLDPACGCGNFLVIAYRELRLLELEIIKALQKGQQLLDISERLRLDVDRFYGIELEEFPSQIAQVAMWLTDHQMNLRVSEEFGEYYIRLPLRKSPNIMQGNALRLDWQSLIDPVPFEKKEQRFDYIFGNPPFIGSKMMNEDQRKEIREISADAKGAGVLDYVSGWYFKAAHYLNEWENIGTRCAFVSTNSITQGEQVGILWKELFQRYKIKIHFAHRTFKWSNEAKGKAAVHVVIVGFSNFDIKNKKIFEYEDIKGEPHEFLVKNINPYLVEGGDIFIERMDNPLCNVPKMCFGNMPLDGGHLLFTNEEKDELLKIEPQAAKYLKPLISAFEFINGMQRWCLWLERVEPYEYRSMPEILKRIDLVKKFRLNSKAPSTQKFAQTPALFRDRNRPKSYILIPSTSSENRTYIPLGFFGEDEVANNSCHIIPDGTIYHFGIVSSKMHVTWLKHIGGRLESRFRYSKDIVYNNFPWPENPTDKQKEKVESAVKKVLETRELFPGSTLADLYDPLTMPPALVKAHQELDKAVDLCYRSQPFPNETKRIEFLFDLYEKYTSGLFREKKEKRSKLG